jgi:S1-C subfamily serine protease
MTSPVDALPRWLVRIRRSAEGLPVGAGVHCGGGHVLTCAHVVADSLTQPTTSVYIDFQYAEQAHLIEAAVAAGGWQPTGDMAMLSIDADAVPTDARAACFGATYSGVSSHRFRVHGYPRGHERDGVLATGVVVGPAGRDFLQLQAESALGYSLEAGFSGSPVWDVDSETVVGIVAAKDRARADGTDPRTGYAIPSEVLVSVWPWLSPAVGGRSAAKEHLRALLEIHRRNVMALEMQEAQYGGFPPVHVLGQLTDLRAKIAEIHRQLGTGHDNES